MGSRKGTRPYGRALPILLLIAMATAGCAGLKPQQSPVGETPVPPATDVAPPVTSQTAAVFFPDWQVQHVIPEARQVPQATGAELATQVVRELLAGPADPHLKRPFPADVKLLEPVKVQDGTAQVNLSKELRNLRGSAAVIAALNSLRLSLTEIEPIKRVQVLVEGQAGGELDGLALEPMDRGLYLYPVIANPDRVRYLQERHDQGLDPWRADPVKVSQWEGRMFGFTAAELQSAKVVPQGAAAAVQVSRDGALHTFTIARNQDARGEAIWTIQALDPLTRHTLSGLPAPIRTWADLYAETTVGISRREGDRTYLLAAVEEGTVQIESVAAENGQLVAYLVEQGTDRLALASVSGAKASLPVVFRWKSAPVGGASKHTAPDALPVVANPHGLPEARLTGEIAVITPISDQAVSGSIAIKGYARHLFEANLVARLLTPQGGEVAATPTTAGACCFDWGSFDFELKHDAPAGSYRLELGDYSARDGSWQRLIAIPVKVSR